MRAGGVSRCAQREPRVWAGVELDLMTDPPEAVAVMRAVDLQTRPAPRRKNLQPALLRSASAVFFSALSPTLSPSTRSRAVSPARRGSRAPSRRTRERSASLVARFASRARHPRGLATMGRVPKKKSKSGGKKKGGGGGSQRRDSDDEWEEGITTITGESDEDDAEMMDEDGGGGDGCVSVVAAPFGPRSFFSSRRAAASDGDAVLDPPPPAARSDAR